MSRGRLVPAVYASNVGYFYPMRVQPETFTLTLNSVANASATGTVVQATPSAVVSKGRSSRGVNARLVRIRFTEGSTPDEYAINGTLTLPVFQPSVWNGYADGQTGTYEVDGNPVPVQFVGKTAEAIR